MARTADDYLQAILSLLPRGRVWSREPEAEQTQALAGFAPTPARVDAAGRALLVDAFPATTVGLLPEWEETLGLPDPCAGPEPTIALRQAQVLARFQGIGGQSVPFFVAFALALGFEITIQEFTGSTTLANTWQVTVAGSGQTPFRAGQNRAGDRLLTITNDAAVLQCEFKRMKPAHTILNWNFI